MAELEAVMTVELQIRGPYPIGEQRLAVNIESGSLAGFADFEGKLSGSVIAPSGDVIVLQKTGTFERNVRLVAAFTAERSSVSSPDVVLSPLNCQTTSPL